MKKWFWHMKKYSWHTYNFFLVAYMKCIGTQSIFVHIKNQLDPKSTDISIVWVLPSHYLQLTRLAMMAGQASERLDYNISCILVCFGFFVCQFILCTHIQWVCMWQCKNYMYAKNIFSCARTIFSYAHEKCNKNQFGTHVEKKVFTLNRQLTIFKLISSVLWWLFHISFENSKLKYLHLFLSSKHTWPF